MYEEIMKARRLAISLMTFLLSMVLVISCAATRQLGEPITEELPFGFISVDSALSQVETLCLAGDYEKAAGIAKPVGQRGYSYYRTDELFYWLGRCNIGLEEPEKAKRCFKALRKYYSRSEVRFPDLAEWEQKARELYDRQIEKGDQKDQVQQVASEQETVFPQSVGPRVSNVFYETDIRQALVDIAAETGVDIVSDPTVSGYVTVELKETPLEEALERLLSPLGFVYKKMDGYYLVGQPSIESPSFPLLAETRWVELKYLRVGQAKTLLPKYYEKYLNIDEKANRLTISAPPHIIERFMADLSVIDTPSLQFMIEAMVIEMGTEARRILGLDWDWTGTKDNNSFIISKLAPVTLDSSFIAELTKVGGDLWGSTFDLRLALRALATAGQVQVKANPRVTTQNGHEAVIRIGKEAYYSLVRGPVNYPYITLEKISTGITLKITPYMGSYSEITNEVAVEVSDVTGAGVDNLPVTSVRSVQTKITVANGQTFGIGGLVVENLKQEENRVPLLGRIPFLGWLFGSTETIKEETEVVILITPHVLIDPREFDTL